MRLPPFITLALLSATSQAQVTPSPKLTDRFLLGKTEAFISSTPNLIIPGKILQYQISPSQDLIIASRLYVTPEEEINLILGNPPQSARFELVYYNLNTQQSRIITSSNQPSASIISFTSSNTVLISQDSNSEVPKYTTVNLINGNSTPLRLPKPDLHIASITPLPTRNQFIAKSLPHVNNPNTKLFLFTNQNQFIKELPRPESKFPFKITPGPQPNTFLYSTRDANGPKSQLLNLQDNSFTEVNIPAPINKSGLFFFMNLPFPNPNPNIMEKIQGLYLFHAGIEETQKPLFLSTQSYAQQARATTQHAIFTTPSGLNATTLQKTDLEAFNKLKAQEVQAEAMRQAKLVATGLHIFAADNNDTFPNGKDWNTAIMPYIKNEDLLNGFTYLGNGETISDINSITEFPIGLIDTEYGTATAYADGSVRWKAKP